jgi:hypothetical protein
MRDYGKVSPKFWTGSTGKALRGDPEAQVLAIYLMTCPMSHMSGVFTCPMIYMAHETGLGIEGASKALERLIEGGFCIYDAPSETVFVVRMAYYQVAESLKPDDKRVKGLLKDVESMPKGLIRNAFVSEYATAFCLGIEPSYEAPSKPLLSQKQEQKQEQEQLSVGCTEARTKVSKGASDEIQPSVAVCIPLRKAGIQCNPQHPDLLAAIDEGVQVRSIVATVLEGKDAGKGNAFAWGIATARSRHAAGPSPVNTGPPGQPGLGPTSKTGAAVMKLQGIINGNQLDSDRDRQGLTGPVVLELGPSARS